MCFRSCHRRQGGKGPERVHRPTPRSSARPCRRLAAPFGGSNTAQVTRRSLITGETGTGKELVARGLHRASRRATGPFVAVNCAAIATPLFESEIFGSLKGAYTGSVGTREGLVGTARGGTLFLDEVGELPVEAQAKLLRLLEAGTYRPVGASEERIADARVIAATNQNVDRPAAESPLRGDLYYRLAALRIHIAPLRERRGDIPALVTHFIARRTKNGPQRCPTSEALASLMAYDWPGNVRELEHAVARTLIRGETGPITRFDTAGIRGAERRRRRRDGVRCRAPRSPARVSRRPTRPSGAGARHQRTHAPATSEGPGSASGGLPIAAWVGVSLGYCPRWRGFSPR